jgi:uncharacterized protein
VQGPRGEAAVRILIDVCHPAHFHFFKHALRRLRERGHELLVTSRQKECAIDLIEHSAIRHVDLGAQHRGSAFGMLRELVVRNARLVRVIRGFRPDVLAAVGGTFVAQSGFLTRTPSVVFYDTAEARLQNLLTYPLVTRLAVPACYDGWVPRNTLRYPGYHELAYLHPAVFTPSRERAIRAGLAEQGRTILLRSVSWSASHDRGLQGVGDERLVALVEALSRLGKVVISSERPLPAALEPMRHRGSPELMHDLMAHCDLYLGESATMASECAVLGVPAIFFAPEGRCYTTDQQRRYGLVQCMPGAGVEDLADAARALLDRPTEHWRSARRALLDATIDVTGLVVRLCESRGAGVEVEPPDLLQ